MTKIEIHVAGEILYAMLNQSETAQRIAEILPIKGKVQLWGDEIYFKIPLEMEEALDATADVEIGDLVYWPVGNAFCIFFGSTPASGPDGQPKVASPGNIFGHVEGDTSLFKKAKNHDFIKIVQKEE